MDRRNFIRRAVGSTLGVVGASTLFTRCDPHKKFEARLTGPDFNLGHKLRTMNFTNVISTEHKDVVIIGGGVSGLAAAWNLKRNNVDFVLLELENQVGGNSRSGKNAISSYPFGAHYLPLPNDLYSPLTDFLKEADVITGYENDQPVLNEYFLSFAPKERLFINDHWQEGVIPISGVPEKDRQQISDFNELMAGYKNAVGADGKEAFCIPIDYSSSDPAYRSLDKISMAAFLEGRGFTSPYLKWYVDYCCGDDFAATSENTSAWAGVHYFSSRKGKAANATTDLVLTWPEGNGFLINKLKKNITKNIATDSLTYEVALTSTGAEISFFDANENVCKKIVARQVIISTPQYSNQRILKDINRNIDTSKFEYAPWLVANISTLNLDLNTKRGETLSWDNVIYGGSGLGYINTTQQALNQYQPAKILTYYKPLTGDIKTERQALYQQNADYWLNLILKDLRRPHPEIERSITDVEIWRWGHGMIRPSPGFIWSDTRQNASASIQNKIHFAHSDLSGASIFEEAFYRGIEASKKVIHG